VAWLGKGGRKPKIHIRIGGRENGVWTVYKSGIARQALGKYKIEYAPATNQLKFYVNDLVHSTLKRGMGYMSMLGADLTQPGTRYDEATKAEKPRISPLKRGECQIGTSWKICSFKAKSLYSTTL